ncbi:hypothetical protein ASF53_13815 [Methylobacterium sp. Leaf123]|uniref:hypothetical protein n=1 Tax=Methylobacterium sp. Leaf123 TaxID=1736264 RepID=UPI0006F311A0|nr:hypothetical protein [Methylobacterium sp. Leaf123]KQQ13250.1 hypothetical protein ASF53_13815 [Methylobacterium sp. Leaf123]
MVKIGTRTMLALIAFSAAGTASARAGEEEQAALCRDDVMRLCLTSIPDRGRIVSCMKAQRASLSPGCRAAFDEGTAASVNRHSASLR